MSRKLVSRPDRTETLNSASERHAARSFRMDRRRGCKKQKETAPQDSYRNASRSRRAQPRRTGSPPEVGEMVRERDRGEEGTSYWTDKNRVHCSQTATLNLANQRVRNVELISWLLPRDSSRSTTHLFIYFAPHFWPTFPAFLSFYP